MRTRKTFTARQRLSILSTGVTIRTRRKSLGLTQAELGTQAGMNAGVIHDLERGTISHRSILPSEPRCLRVFATLARLEREVGGVKIKASRVSPKRVLAAAKRLVVRVRKPNRSVSAVAVMLSLCPDQRSEYGAEAGGLWITQAGCDAMRKSNPICRSRNDGKPCSGVRFRRDLERKEVPVKYTPPRPAYVEENRMRFEDWV